MVYATVAHVQCLAWPAGTGHCSLHRKPFPMCCLDLLPVLASTQYGTLAVVGLQVPMPLTALQLLPELQMAMRSLTGLTLTQSTARILRRQGVPPASGT
jgi:hypothetical protein